MKIESVEWSNYHLSFESIIESWSVAADILAILKAVVKVEAADEETLAKTVSSLKK